MKSIKIAMLFGLPSMVLLLAGAFVNIEQVSADDPEAACSPEGAMECQITAEDQCKHRTCRDSEWGAWAEIGQPGQYECKQNTAGGGGEKCKFKKSHATSIPPDTNAL